MASKTDSRRASLPKPSSQPRMSTTNEPRVSHSDLHVEMEREAWEQEQLAMTQDEINAEFDADLFSASPQSSKAHIKMSSRPTTMLSVDKLRVCACKKTGTKRANGFMLDKEGEWHCDGCYASVRDKYRGARQPSADDESEVEELDMTTLAAALPVATPAPTVEETLRARIAELEKEVAALRTEKDSDLYTWSREDVRCAWATLLGNDDLKMPDELYAEIQRKWDEESSYHERITGEFNETLDLFLRDEMGVEEKEEE